MKGRAVGVLMGTRLFTIGYEGLDLRSFLHCLERNSVQCILDVREIPSSRKKGFSKTPLSQALEERGIRYVHFRELGSPASIRAELRLARDYTRFFRRMEEYLATQMEGIERAYDYVGRMTCCLLCYEKQAAECHRKIVARRIKERDGNGLEVDDLEID